MELELISLLAGFVIKELGSFTPHRQIGEELELKRQIHNKEMIKRSIRLQLKKPFTYFTREDIVRAAAQANWQGQTKNEIMVDEVLKEMQLDDF